MGCARNKIRRGVNKNTNNYGGKNRGSGSKAETYKKAQDLYHKSRNSLVAKIVSGTALETTEETPSLQAVEDLYGGILERPATEDRNTYKPFSSDEVEKAKTSWATSAPGADGITTSSGLATRNEILCVLFSIILMRNPHLICFRQLRTTLIYKAGQRSDPNNWRPQTIGSAL
nr:unnamed protein product [Callosobruchus analis]